MAVPNLSQETPQGAFSIGLHGTGVYRWHGCKHDVSRWPSGDAYDMGRITGYQNWRKPLNSSELGFVLTVAGFWFHAPLEELGITQDELLQRAENASLQKVLTMRLTGQI